MWLWNCEGGHHGGTIIDFIEHAHGVAFPRAMEYLRQLICPMPKLNGNGESLREILKPLSEDHGSWIVDHGKNKTTSHPPSIIQDPSSELVERSEDQATFKYGDLIYQVKDLKNATKNHLKIILKLTHQDSQFTDRTDLHSARARRSFSNQAAERLSLQSAQVEEHLEVMMEELEESVQHSALSGQEKQNEMTEQEKEEALTLLKDPNLLDRMASDLDRLGYVGESTNKKILYLIATSRLMDKPTSAIVRSGSAGGKSTLMEYVLQFIPRTEWHFFTRITAQSLFYMSPEELDGKIVAVDERDGSSDADYSIRSLQSRGKLSLAASGKDPKTGEWKTHLKEFSARTPYMESSTKEKINEENLNRCFELYLDESIEQTKRIQESQRKKASGEGITLEEEEKLKRLYHNAQRLLKAHPVKIPRELEIDFPYQTLRSRRDYDKFLSLIKVIALLYQYQRGNNSPDPFREVTPQAPLKIRGGIDERGGQIIEATLKDYEMARDLTRGIFNNIVLDLPQPLAKFYDLLKKKVNEEAKELSTEDFTFTRRDIRKWTALPDHVVKSQMRQLEDLEYVILKRSGRTTRKVYQLCAQ
ncbi:MAG: hypothetical protein HYS08_00650 [Chlamydiae bacterium]|nr:hypothetical protein [Chlamydiota bacterium]